MSRADQRPTSWQKYHLRSRLKECDVLPLLHAALDAGAATARVIGTEGVELWRAVGGEPGETLLIFPILVEGDSVGRLELRGWKGRRKELQPIAAVLALALSTLIRRSIEPVRIDASEEDRAGTELSQLKAEVAANEARITALKCDLQIMQRYLGRFAAMLHFYRDHLELDLPQEVLVTEADQKWRELKLSQVMAELERCSGRGLTHSDAASSQRHPYPQPHAPAKHTA